MWDYCIWRPMTTLSSCTSCFAGDFHAPVVDQRIVSISASKRAVNSLFVNLLKGWMEETSGVRAIPVMQLFSRLSSCQNRRSWIWFVKWLLDEINLSKTFAASSFGEVTILVFMFFTLMLRNWGYLTAPSLQTIPLKPIPISLSVKHMLVGILF